jgi:hypothetical protein
MDVVLGVAVTSPVARLALVDAVPGGSGVIDQSVVDVATNSIEKLTETVVGTNQLLASENHRLVATGLVWSDPGRADELRRALEDSGVQDLTLVSESQAATALLQYTSGAEERPGSAVLLVDDETATLSMVGADDAPPTVLAAQPLEGSDATAACVTLLGRLRAEPGAVSDVYLMGTSADLTTIADQLRTASSAQVEVADDPAFAIARGAAMAAAAATMTQVVRSPGETTTMMPAAEITREPERQLAYSMADEDSLLPMEYEGADGEEGEAEAAAPWFGSRPLLISNAVVAFAVIGFAVLAVAVAITIRPTASQQPVQGHQNAAPGKFMPLLPTQQQAPVPPPPPDQPDAGFQGGTVPVVSGPTPQQGGVPGGVVPNPPEGGTPAPVPGAPATPGAPANPIPIPIIVPYPGWTPPTRPTTPTTPPSTPSSSSPSTSPSSSMPSTPPSTPPSSSMPASSLTQTSQVVTTSAAAPPVSTAPMSPVYTPPQTTAAPPPVYTQPQTVAPQPAYTPPPQTVAPQPVAPQPVTPRVPIGPRFGGHGGSG